MTSTRAQGAAWERRCKEYLESLGFKVDKARATLRVIGPGRFCSTANDFFGCIDLLAISPSKDYTLFIQCTTAKDTGTRAHKRREIELVPWNFKVHRVQLWTKNHELRSWVSAHELEVGISESHEKQFHWEPSGFKMVNGEWPGGDIL